MSDDFWERAAQADPLWAVLSDPQRKNRQWDLPSFFATGEREITLLLHQLRTLGHAPKPGRALDFGCGVGRLTQALGRRFQEVVGIDVSPTMLRVADRLNRMPQRVMYVLNQAASLELFGSDSFDFVYSDIVLQHLRADLAQGYIAEFLRVLRPGGIAVFQMASHRREHQGDSGRSRHMSENAYRAHIRLTAPAVGSLHAGEATSVHIEVTNASAEVWNQDLTGVINVGNHWRDPAGEMVIQDDGRSLLPAMLSPGDATRLTINVQAPDVPGDCICEIDVVHEGISWFADLGSQALRIPIRIVSRRREQTSPAGEHAIETEAHTYPNIYDALPPFRGSDISEFPMFGVLREQVLALVRAKGGEPFFVEVDERAGPEWHGYRYFLRKLNS